MKTLRMGAGAGYAGDRIEPAVELAEKGEIDVLVFECLAERTIALAQQARMRDPEAGYDPMLAARMRAVLPACRARGVRIVTNMGAANPAAAGRVILDVARSFGDRDIKVAVVTGDDVTETVRAGDYRLEETGGRAADLGNRLVSANAYLGAAPIARALDEGADVVVTGRVGDPALYLGPLLHAFGWALDDWDALGRGTLAGHLLECAGQITGGYFADPGRKDVPDLARLGFPIGEVGEDGSIVITKVPGSGGAVTAATCTEQLLYEVHDPARYVQPDVVADFSAVRMAEIGPDRVRVEGARGHPRTGLLKTSVGYLDGCVGEGQISYGGSGAVARGRLALDIVRERLALTGVPLTEARYDLLGIDSLHGEGASGARPDPYEVRARVAARTDTLADARRIGDEVETLYTNGPAGGGGVVKSAREIVAVQSVLLPEELVSPVLTMLGAAA